MVKTRIMTQRRYFKQYGVGDFMEGQAKYFPLHPESKSQPKERYYPDEWLIASIVEKYARLKKIQNVVVLTEPWNTEKSRNGNANTKRFNDQIIQTINESKEELILAPYLYHWHHTGFAIHASDTKPQKVIYLDPKGDKKVIHPDPKSPPKEVPREPHELAIDFRTKLDSKMDVVSTKQQHGGLICGFILTASFIKFIEEYQKEKTITTEGFIPYNDPNYRINTLYMFVLYINNLQINAYEPIVNEVMLAKKELWEAFIEEQKLDDRIYRKIKHALSLQQSFLKKAFQDGHQDNPLCKAKLDFIRDFQTKAIEIIFSKNNIESRITDLILQNDITLKAKKVDDVKKLDLETNINNLYDRIFKVSSMKPELTENKFEEKQMSISKQDLNQILSSYHSTSALAHCCFFTPDRSVTIRKLRALSTNADNITKAEISAAIASDSSERAYLFTHGYLQETMWSTFLAFFQREPAETSTDNVIFQLHAKFL